MSNYTYNRTRTISSTEYNRLVRAGQEATALRNNNAALQNTTQQLRNSLRQATQKADAMEQQFRITSQQIVQMQQHHNAEVQSIRDQMTQVYLDIARKYQDTKDDLNQMSNDIMQATTEQIEANNQIVKEQIRQTRESINGQIEQMRKETENRYNQLDQKITKFEGGVKEEREAAREYYDEARQLRIQIGTMNPELLIPGGVRAVDNLLRTAENDIALAGQRDVHVPIAYGSARTAFFEAIHFMDQLIDAEQERQRQLMLTQALSEQVGAQIDNSRTLSKFRLDTDHWSFGDFHRREQAYLAIKQNLKNPDHLSTTNLQDLQNSFRDISTAVDQTVSDALINMRTSDNVTELAQRINEALSIQNMDVTAHAFEGDDKRGNYRFVLKNPGNGLTVVITITVQRGNAMELRVESDIIDYGTMEALTAEALVRGIVNRISGNVTGQNCTCQGEGGTYVRQEVQHDPELRQWRDPFANHTHTDSQHSNGNVSGHSH